MVWFASPDVKPKTKTELRRLRTLRNQVDDLSEMLWALCKDMKCEELKKTPKLYEWFMQRSHLNSHCERMARYEAYDKLSPSERHLLKIDDRQLFGF